MKEGDKKKRIVCLHEKSRSYDQIHHLLSNRGYLLSVYSDANEAFTTVLNDPPAIIMVSTGVAGWDSFMYRIRGDTAYKHLPLILLTQQDSLGTLMKRQGLPCDDFLLCPVQPEELLLRVQLRETTAALNLDANPLTRLPGNVAIMSTIKQAIEGSRNAALCYLDLDNFKAFNDRYGFVRGDEAIRMTARIVTNVVQAVSKSDSFVGHVGGDDFFFVIPAQVARKCCENIIRNFDLVITTLIDDQDRERGYIESKDRAGNPQRFPLLSLSIAVIDLRVTTINHPGEASTIAGELKKAVKKREGSNYLINRRKSLKG